MMAMVADDRLDRGALGVSVQRNGPAVDVNPDPRLSTERADVADGRGGRDFQPRVQDLDELGLALHAQSLWQVTALGEFVVHGVLRGCTDLGEPGTELLLERGADAPAALQVGRPAKPTDAASGARV